MPDNETPAVDSEIDSIPETPPEVVPVDDGPGSQLRKDAIQAPLRYSPPQAATRPPANKDALNPRRFARPPPIVIPEKDKRFSGILQPKPKRA